MHRAATSSLLDHPFAIERAPSAQDYFEGLRLISEGQLLIRKQTKAGFTEALAKFKEAVASFQKAGLREGMSGALLWEGIAYDSLGEYREALNAFLEAQHACEGSYIGFMRPVFEAMVGSAYANLGETDKALEMLENALPELRKFNIWEVVAYGLKGLAEVNVQIGRKQKALEYLNESLSLYQQNKYWRYEIQMLTEISALRSSLGESTKAIESATAAVERAKEKNAPDADAVGQFALGAAYFSAGQTERAVARYKRALQLFLEQADTLGVAGALNNLGQIYIAQGEIDLALDHFNRALKLSESINESQLGGYVLNNLAVLYYRRGEPLNAIRRFEEALAVAQRNNDVRLKAVIATSMTDFYFWIDSREYSLKLLEEAAAVFRKIEEPTHEYEALIGLADGYASLGRYDEALAVLRPLLESRRLAEHPIAQAYVLRQMGFVYGDLGYTARDPAKALMYYSEALSRLDAAEDDVGKVELYAGWAAALITNGDYREAEDLLGKALSLARKARVPRSEAMTLALLGFLYEKQGNISKAESAYDEGTAVSESLRSSARIPELKTAASNLFVSLFSSAVLLKFKLGKWADAFELAERARARTFLDQMKSVRIDIQKGADPELIQQEQSLRFDVHSLEEKLRSERRNNQSSEAVALISASLKEKEDAYKALQLRLGASNAKYAELQSHLPRPLTQIQGLLGPRTTLVSYFVAPDRTLAFVVDAHSIQAVDIPVRETDLRAAISWFRDFADLRDPQPQSLKQLHTWLIAPIKQYIKTDEVAIVPNGILHYVPFAALTDNGRTYFGDEHVLYYLPSASILPSIQRTSRPAGRPFLVAQSQANGLQVLRYADEEARNVASIYHTQPLLTGRVTKAQFLRRTRSCNLLHIAAHAELNANSPLFSRILLSPNGKDSGAIEVREVYGMDLSRTNLVVLSACQTHLGSQSRGDEIIGLNRAFIYAGTPTVIASLWTVDDESTSYLMKSFYAHLKHGLSKAEALQAAQSDARKKYPSPYYWAPFVLTGDAGSANRPSSPERRAARRH